MAGFERVLGFEGEKRTPCFGLVQPQQVSLGANGPEYSNSRGGLWRLRRRFAICAARWRNCFAIPSGEAELLRHFLLGGRNWGHAGIAVAVADGGNETNFSESPSRMAPKSAMSQKDRNRIKTARAKVRKQLGDGASAAEVERVLLENRPDLAHLLQPQESQADFFVITGKR